MHRLFSIISTFLLLSSISFGQPTVDIPLVVTETTFTQNMWVGLDLTATTCLDPTLGEQEAPPAPPPGSFHIVFDLDPYGCPALTVWKDYRNAPSFPYSDTVQHTLSWQRSASSTSINIQYVLPTNAVMRIKDILGLNILNLGPLTGTGSTTIPGSYPLTSAFLIMEYNDITPVELTSFSAIVSGQEVHLNWTTATETNNRGFDIERKSNLVWENIGYVAGFGTTTEPKAYSFIDENVSNGKYIYRLKQIDYDGSYEYSNEIELDIDFLPSEYILFQNHPNPFNPSTKIQFAVPKQTQLKINVYNVMGELISTIADGSYEAGFHQVTFNSDDLATGAYIYRIESDGLTISKKMLLIK